MPLPDLTRLTPSFARPGFWTLLLCVTVLSLLPTEYLSPQVFSLWDKAQHALAFTALALLGLQAYPHRRWRVLAGLLVFGGLIELAQAATGWRHGEWADWLADAVGLALGLALTLVLAGPLRHPVQ